jgi:hypothetical protein
MEAHRTFPLPTDLKVRLASGDLLVGRAQDEGPAQSGLTRRD